MILAHSWPKGRVLNWQKDLSPLAFISGPNVFH